VRFTARGTADIAKHQWAPGKPRAAKPKRAESKRR
jgi:hypothetical protein